MAAQLNYGFGMPVGYPGQIVDSAYYDKTSWLNPMRANTGTLTFGGTVGAAGTTYSITLTPSDGGAPITFSYLVQAGDTTNALLAASFNTAFNVANDMFNVASSSNASAVNTITFKRPGFGPTYTVSTVAPAGATLAYAAVANSSFYQRVGTFVRRSATAGEDNWARAITTGTAIGEIVGVCERKRTLVDLTAQGISYPAIAPGYDFSVVNTGRVFMTAYEAITTASTIFIWIDHTDLSVPVGGVVAAANGGKAISAATICKPHTSAALGGIFELEITRGP